MGIYRGSFCRAGDVHYERLLFIHLRMIQDTCAYTLTEVLCVRKGCKLFRMALVLIMIQVVMFSLLMYGCTRVIRDASDELVMYSWSTVLEGGAEVSLTFEDEDAAFSVKNGENSSTVKGYCVLSSDQFVIIDEKTEESYTFDYILRGDSVELSYQNSLIILERC